MTKPKPIIEKISLSSDQQKRLEDYLALFNKPEKYSHIVSSATKRRKIMEIIGGKLCFFCYAIPTYQVSYPYQGINRIERFCNDCFAKRADREKEGNKCLKSFESNQDIINEVEMQERLASQNY